jgi:hypothetical protein
VGGICVVSVRLNNMGWDVLITLIQVTECPEHANESRYSTSVYTTILTKSTTQWRWELADRHRCAVEAGVLRHEEGASKVLCIHDMHVRAHPIEAMQRRVTEEELQGRKRARPALL